MAINNTKINGNIVGMETTKMLFLHQVNKKKNVYTLYIIIIRKLSSKKLKAIITINKDDTEKERLINISKILNVYPRNMF